MMEPEARHGMRDNTLAGECVVIRALEEVLRGMRIINEVSTMPG